MWPFYRTGCTKASKSEIRGGGWKGGVAKFSLKVEEQHLLLQFIKELVGEACRRRYSVSLQEWQVSLIWSFIISIYCVGGLLGSLVAAPLVTRLGRWVRGGGGGGLWCDSNPNAQLPPPRKRCLLLNNFVTISGAVLMLLSRTARSFEMIMAARLIYGISSGQSEEISFSPH